MLGQQPAELAYAWSIWRQTWLESPRTGGAAPNRYMRSQSAPIDFPGALDSRILLDLARFAQNQFHDVRKNKFRAMARASTLPVIVGVRGLPLRLHGVRVVESHRTADVGGGHAAGVKQQVGPFWLPSPTTSSVQLWRLVWKSDPRKRPAAMHRVRRHSSESVLDEAVLGMVSDERRCNQHEAPGRYGLRGKAHWTECAWKCVVSFYADRNPCQERLRLRDNVLGMGSAEMGEGRQRRRGDGRQTRRSGRERMRVGERGVERGECRLMLTGGDVGGGGRGGEWRGGEWSGAEVSMSGAEANRGAKRSGGSEEGASAAERRSAVLSREVVLVF